MTEQVKIAEIGDVRPGAAAMTGVIPLSK